jgi:hypothetical protein
MVVSSINLFLKLLLRGICCAKSISFCALTARTLLNNYGTAAYSPISIAHIPVPVPMSKIFGPRS